MGCFRTPRGTSSVLLGSLVVALAAEASPAVTRRQCTVPSDLANELRGQRYEPGLDDVIKARTNASIVRKLRPGAAATMDYREDRVNVDLDDFGLIVAVRCE